MLFFCRCVRLRGLLKIPLPPPSSSSPPQHFVSERKYDEDLGKAVRFTFDLEPLKSSITGFGSGTPPPRKRQNTLSLFPGSHDLYLLPLFQFTIRVRDTRTGPVVAPRPPPLPARASRKRRLFLPPRPRARPAKPVRRRTNRSGFCCSSLRGRVETAG